MSKTSLLILSLLFLLTACSKKDEEFDYVVNGARDVTIDIKPEVVDLVVQYKSGVAENVSLSMSDLPSGVFAYIQSSGGTPSFNTMLKITAMYDAKQGIYPITLTAKSKSGITKEYKFNLTINQSKSALLVGTWKNTTSGDDVNLDGVYQEGEADLPPLDTNELVIFSDNTGYIKYEDGNTEPFILQYTGNPGMFMYFNNSREYVFIGRINSSELVIGSHLSSVANWNRYLRK